MPRTNAKSIRFIEPRRMKQRKKKKKTKKGRREERREEEEEEQERASVLDINNSGRNIEDRIEGDATTKRRCSWSVLKINRAVLEQQPRPEAGEGESGGISGEPLFKLSESKKRSRLCALSEPLISTRRREGLPLFHRRFHFPGTVVSLGVDWKKPSRLTEHKYVC